MTTATLTVDYNRMTARDKFDACLDSTASIVISHFASDIVTAVFRFDLSSLPSKGLVFDAVSIRTNVTTIGVTDYCDLIALLYDTDGQADPELPSCRDFSDRAIHSLFTGYVWEFTPEPGLNNSPVFGSDNWLETGIHEIICDAAVAGPLIAQARYDVGRVAILLNGPMRDLSGGTNGSGIVEADTTELLLVYHELTEPVETGRRKHRARITDQFGAAKGQVLP